MSEEIVKPLWDGWSPPNKPSEALEIGEKYATMEGLWCSGLLLGLKSEVGDEEDVELRAELLAKGIGCGDVKACATGILIMSVLDGPAVNAYFTQTFQYSMDVEGQLTRHNVGGPATVFLAAGMAKAAAEAISSGRKLDIEEIKDSPDRMIEEYIAGPQPGPRGGVSRLVSEEKFRQRKAGARKLNIMTINDSYDVENDFPGESTGEEHHALIVKGFRYGREFAVQHESRLGFGTPDAPPDAAA